MNRKVQLLILSIASLISGPWATELLAIYVGNIQFPYIVEKVPSVRAYFAGNKIACSVNNESKKTTFSIPSYQHGTPLYILVTEHVHWAAEENTIKYLTADIGKPYKLYLVKPHRLSPNKKGEMNEVCWDIQESILDLDGKIPDNTVIVVFNPKLIDTLEGGNSITLPSLCVHSNIFECGVGSERELHTMAAELLLSSIDSDSIHKKTDQIVKPYYRLKTILALTT